MISSRQRMNVISLDFDGCIFHKKGYLYNTSPNRLIETNQTFIDQVAERIRAENFAEAVFMFGTNRQDKWMDDMNNQHMNRGSCFPAMQRLLEEFEGKLHGISTRIDGYLLADTYCNKTPGATHQAIMTQDKSFQHDRHYIDNTKMTLLYAQMHKLASAPENKDKDIILDFYDDRRIILSSLHDFFNEHRDLMPRNIVLRLHRYKGAEISETFTLDDQVKILEPIPGAGEPDRHFHKSLWRMIEAAGLKHARYRRKSEDEPNDVRQELLKLDRLQSFKEQREAFSREEAQKEMKLMEHANYISEFSIAANALCSALGWKTDSSKSVGPSLFRLSGSQKLPLAKQNNAPVDTVDSALKHSH